MPSFLKNVLYHFNPNYFKLWCLPTSKTEDLLNICKCCIPIGQSRKKNCLTIYFNVTCCKSTKVSCCYLLVRVSSYRHPGKAFYYVDNRNHIVVSVIPIAMVSKHVVLVSTCLIKYTFRTYMITMILLNKTCINIS